jgi:hypothetical protein
MSEGQGLSGYFKGLSLKIIMFMFEDNPFKTTKLQPIIATTSKIWTFDLEGQGHLWIKVKVSVVY